MAGAAQLELGHRHDPGGSTRAARHGQPLALAMSPLSGPHATARGDAGEHEHETAALWRCAAQIVLCFEAPPKT